MLAILYIVITFLSRHTELVDLLFLTAGRPRRTVKRIHVDLPPGDRALLDAIPRAAPTREAVLASHLATAAEYLPRARALVVSTGGRWPAELERATDAYLRERLGVGLPPSELTAAPARRTGRSPG